MEATITLTKSQKSKIKKYLKNPEGVLTISLKKTNTNGTDKIILPKRQYNKLLKSRKNETGCDIVFNPTVAKSNATLFGGEITTATIAQVIKPIQAIASKLLTKEAEDRLDAKLARLKGKGVEDKTLENLRDGFLYGLKSPDKGVDLLWNLVNHFGEIDPVDAQAQAVAKVESTGKKVVKSGRKFI